MLDEVGRFSLAFSTVMYDLLPQTISNPNTPKPATINPETPKPRNPKPLESRVALSIEVKRKPQARCRSSGLRGGSSKKGGGGKGEQNFSETVSRI